MEVTVSDQKLYVVSPRFSDEQARERAWDHKGAAFGSLSRLFLRPKGDEIKVAAVEKRYDPLWHVVAHRRVVFDRGREYRVPVGDAAVQRVTIAGSEYEVAAGPPRHYVIRGVEHCVEDVTVDRTVDALTGADSQAQAVVGAERQEVSDPADLAPADAVVVPPETKASLVVQRLVQQLVTPYEADTVFEETITIDHLHLLYHPVAAFEYVWEARGKRAVVEFDLVTGEVRTDGRALEQQVRRMFTREVLFDLGAETINLVVPGGAIALKIGKAIAEHQRGKKA